MDTHDSDPTSQEDARYVLRSRAEHLVDLTDHPGLEAISPEDIRRLIHELRVHQIELEMQNEELRHTHYDLEIAHARYFDLYDMAPVGYITLNPDGIIQEMNLTAAMILHVSRTDVIRHPLSLFVAAEDQDIYYLYLRRLAKTREAQVCELRMLRLDHSVLWVRLETTVAYDAAGEASIYRTVMSDITERVQAEVALRELNATLEQRVDQRTADLRMSEEQIRHTNIELARSLQLKDEFLSMMSHELRTPLNTILLITESMLEGFYGPLSERQHHVLGSVAQSGRHLLALISDLLDITRIAAGHELLNPMPVNVDDICDMALMMIMPIAQARDISVDYTISPEITTLLADERRLVQILVNLLNNALKFTPPDGKVGLDVTADAARGCIQFSVWDTGIGIASTQQDQIFEPFTQLDRGLSREYEGIGMGLTLVHHLVDLHGGSITLESNPGEGSRFIVSLPWSAPPHQPPSAVAESSVPVVIDDVPPSTPITKPLRVLVADDHEPTLTLYTDLLRVQGYQVSTARTGDQVLAQVREIRPDVVVLDIQMPGINGLTVIHHIRGDQETANLAIIALTALAMPGDRERCLAAGANAYLAKPVSLHALLATITALS